MFENLLFQPAGQQLAEDIRRSRLPNALLFVGPPAAGKLTAALELARVLACTARPAGDWQCVCGSCLKHKSLVSTSLLLAGSRGCSLEIAAAARTFLDAVASGAPYLRAARYLFVRSVRKLSARFSPVLWEGEDKVPRIAPILSSMDEDLEELERIAVPGAERPLDFGRAEKLVKDLISLSGKLESGFMYEAIPVSQMRRASSWARYRPESGKKVVILENADRMQEGSRNAMLKILEEPPEDVVFVLTATRRNALMPTILSRVRPYSFAARDAASQAQVISRVFHGEVAPENLAAASIEGYLLSFLPVCPGTVEAAADQFVREVMAGRQPDIGALTRACGGFEPRLLLDIFFRSVSGALRNLGIGERGPVVEPAGQADAPAQDILRQFRLAELCAQCLEAVHQCHSHITVYNQGIAAALELLAADISLLARKYRGGAII